MKKNDAFVLLSVFKTNKSNSENEENHKKSLKHLKGFGINFKEVFGVYNGNKEKSILIPIINVNFDFAMAKQLCAIYDQESILFVDSERNAELVFLGLDKTEKLGKFIVVGKGVAEQCQNYTVNGKDHYICDFRHLN